MHKKKETDSPKTFSRLHGRAKLQYVWDYYKLQILLICLCIYVIIWACCSHFTRKNIVLYTAFANVTMNSSLTVQLTDEYLSAHSLNPAKNQVYCYKDFYISNTPSSENLEYAYASSTKLLAALDSKRLDVIFMNKEALDALTLEGYLMEIPSTLSNCLPESAISQYSVDLSGCPLIQSAGFSDALYIGIAANSPHTEEAISYIQYIWNASASDSFD